MEGPRLAQSTLRALVHEGAIAERGGIEGRARLAPFTQRGPAALQRVRAHAQRRRQHVEERPRAGAELVVAAPKKLDFAEIGSGSIF